MSLEYGSTDPIDRERFPVDEWRLVETFPSDGDLGLTETLFAVGNGYLGMRGTPPEGRPSEAHGTFVNGFHETWDIHHAEQAYGFAHTGQTIVNAPDSTVMKLYVDDEPLLISMADLVEYERVLDMRDGELRRHLVWRTPSGKVVRIDTTRMISFTERHLAIMTIEVTMLSGDAPVVISSQILNRQDGADEYHDRHALAPHVDLASDSGKGSGDKGGSGGSAGKGGEDAKAWDPRRAGAFTSRVLVPQGDWHSERRMILGYRTARSGMTLAVAADHSIETDDVVEELISTEPDLGKRVYRIDATEGTTTRITKVVAYHTSRGVPARELFDRCRRTLDRVRRDGIAHYVEAQRDWLSTYWDNADVTVEDQPAIQQAIRWNLFQIAQAASRADQLGVAAKGVTGSGYEGHYFWDTEIYVVPFLSYTFPTAAKNLLRFRVNLLDHARQRARELAQRGALFPWRTINGLEASAYYAAGTAQYHIDADVAFAVAKYCDATGDRAFLRHDGVEILVETARLWADLGFWRVDGGRTFHIHGVTGPDEYTTVVNNNLFTNVMARFNLERAAQAVLDIRENDPTAYARLKSRLHLKDDEPAEWEACAAAMAIPFDEGLGIHPQDENFLDRELWDLSQTPADKRPLLLNYHPLVIYRFQVLKQADVVLALLLQGDRFTHEQKRANFEYYDPITTGDSSLSAVVQSIIAAEVGHQQLAMHYFLSGLYVDLGDLHGNTADGVHIASAGGVWNSLVYGFAGMRDAGGDLSFDPRLPEAWQRLCFNLRVRGTRFRVELEAEKMTFVHLAGDAVSVTVRGESVDITAGEPVEVPLDGQGPRLTHLVPRTPKKIVRPDGTVITAGVPTDPDALEREDRQSSLATAEPPTGPVMPPPS
ncbi:alpha,alpha-trehalose phosphorylase [Knoellia remsis]|uniref:Alpha,alpha-trehalose phosphorylase n=1 Tax=Knoellia remsis TaxID=407159 RepID=A0A2T0UR25_9MICO|nr:glycosyl hydrolase family 65 protein [Knoellia remsis]PRY60318.1 alpha,alpha-trehalose phosphorylase [Knoellia remsis]